MADARSNSAASSPVVLAVGDVHVKKFDTWLDDLTLEACARALGPKWLGILRTSSCTSIPVSNTPAGAATDGLCGT